MKKIILIVLGVLLLSIPCYSQALVSEDQQRSARQFHSKSMNIDFFIIYGVKKICPDGYAKYNMDFTTCYGCETTEEFQQNEDKGYYVRVYRDIYEKWLDDWSKQPWTYDANGMPIPPMLPPPPPPPLH